MNNEVEDDNDIPDQRSVSMYSQLNSNSQRLIPPINFDEQMKARSQHEDEKGDPIPPKRRRRPAQDETLRRDALDIISDHLSKNLKSDRLERVIMDAITDPYAYAFVDEDGVSFKSDIEGMRDDILETLILSFKRVSLIEDGADTVARHKQLLIPKGIPDTQGAWVRLAAVFNARTPPVYYRLANLLFCGSLSPMQGEFPISFATNGMRLRGILDSLSSSLKPLNMGIISKALACQLRDLVQLSNFQHGFNP